MVEFGGISTEQCSFHPGWLRCLIEGIIHILPNYMGIEIGHEISESLFNQSGWLMVHVKGPVFFFCVAKNAQNWKHGHLQDGHFSLQGLIRKWFSHVFFFHRKKSPRMSSYLTDSPGKTEKKTGGYPANSVYQSVNWDVVVKFFSQVPGSFYFLLSLRPHVCVFINWIKGPFFLTIW